MQPEPKRPAALDGRALSAIPAATSGGARS